jgi:putative transposase
MVRSGAEEVTGMPIPRATPISVTDRQRRGLERLARAATTPQAIATRARVVLGVAGGASNRGLSQRLGLARNTVRAWRGRWAAAREALLTAELEGDDAALDQVIRGVLADEPRPGAPARFSPEQLCQLMAIACEPPEASGRPLSHWTPRELAAEVVARGIVEAISARTVGRFLVLGGGRAQAAPQSVLADATGRRAGRVRGAGGGRL